MSQKSFDPKKFIDREFETELFEGFLKFDTGARIMAICDEGGMGKSFLLEKFQYRCRTVKPRTPVSLIALDELPDQSPLSLIKTAVLQLSGFKLKFDDYSRLEAARVAANLGIISGAVDARGAQFTHAKDFTISGVRADRVEKIDVYPRATKLSREQEELARTRIVDCFLEELLLHASKQPIVVILDSFERCGEDLRAWIVEFLIARPFFSQTAQPNKLALLIAGREIPLIYNECSDEEYEQVVITIRQLRKWTKEHVKECLNVHGYKYGEAELDAFHILVENGLPPSQVVQSIQALKRGKFDG
jgi:hypothetical protein